MERFEELKQELLKRAKDAHACKEQYARAYNTETIEQLMKVCRDNFVWACNHRVLDVDIIKLYHDEFALGYIYANEDTSEGYLLCYNASVKASGNTGVVAKGDASVKASGNVYVEAYDNVIVEAYLSANVEAYGNANVEAYDSVRVEAYDNARVEAWDNTIVIAHDNARVEAWDDAYITSFSIIEVKLSGRAMYRRMENNTIKYANPRMKFELVE